MAAGKPKGGRGKKAPYHTKLMRVPEPIAAQVDALGLQYQEFIAAGGDPANPPLLLKRIQKQPDAVKQKRTRTAPDKLIEKTSSAFVEVEKLSKEQRLWKELNRRQPIYLRLIFEIDQHREVLSEGRIGDAPVAGRPVSGGGLNTGRFLASQQRSGCVSRKREK
jgi:hypothetical protein